MSRYVNVKVNVSEGQIEKIKKAAQSSTGVSIKLLHGDLAGDHILALMKA